jgi:prepilin-type N-terminal cleavage/methylation domain-containing protein
MKYIYRTKKNKGFTLIEMLVSLALFSIVLVISGGVIISVIDVNRRNQLISSVVNNLNYSTDSMIRDIKTGYLYKCDYYRGDTTIAGLKNSPEKGECPEGADNITLLSTISGKDVVVKYELIKPSSGNNFIQKTVYSDTMNSSSYSITDKINVQIKSLSFTVNNPSSLKDKDVPGAKLGQPSVFVLIKGLAGNGNVEASRFYLQTFISQRVVNVTDFQN